MDINNTFEGIEILILGLFLLLFFARLIWIKSWKNNRKLIEKIKKMYNNMNSSEKEKWKKEKKKSFLLANFISFVIAIVLDLIIFFPEFGKDSKQVVFVFFYSNVDNPFFIILIDYIWDNR